MDVADDAEPTWSDQAASLARHATRNVRANARLFVTAETRWSKRVVPRTSMNVLLLTVRGEPYPVPGGLYCTASAAICEVGFVANDPAATEVSHSLLIDGATWLDLALERLGGKRPGLPPTVDNGTLWSAQLAWLHERNAEALADIVQHVHAEWESLVLPLPDENAVSFVSVDQPPTALRSSVAIAADDDRWIVSSSSAPAGQSPPARCSAHEVVPRLRQVLATLAR